MSRKRMTMTVGCLAMIFLFFASSWAAEAEPKVGQTVGNPKLPQPLSDQDAKYLGLEKADEFSLQDIKAPYVLVEQMNTACKFCMVQAPVLNGLYHLVNQDPSLKNKLRVLAVGKSNDETGMKMWKLVHRVPFPMIADPSAAFAKALNFSKYPVTLVLEKTGKIVWVHLGALDNAEEALKGIKAVVK